MGRVSPVSQSVLFYEHPPTPKLSQRFGSPFRYCAGWHRERPDCGALVSCFVIRQHDEAVNSGGSKCFHRAMVQGADGSHGDLELAKFGRASMLVSGPLQTLHRLFCFLDGEPETVPAIAHGDGTPQCGWALTTNHNWRHRPLDGTGV